ncbi:MAG: hypothetical protein ACJAYC_001419 [Halieaceae bacterium]|jgi:hypothetical protein
MEKVVLAITLATLGTVAFAGPPGWVLAPVPVPVDSPFVLSGVVIVIALAGARIVRNRSK